MIITRRAYSLSLNQRRLTNSIHIRKFTNEQDQNNGPLKGVKILDMTRILAGPFCSMLLGDLGAIVYKIERPDGGDDTRAWGPPFSKGGESTYYMSINRNKRSIVVDIKKPEGLQVIYDLATQCDVAIENFPPGKADKLGIGYEKLSSINPKLIYTSITGFGSTGPYKDRLAYDVMISAMGGLMAITGPESGDPVKVGVALTDVTAGLFAHGSIMAALYAREKTGKGQKIETSLLEAQIACLVNAASSYLIGGVEPTKMGTGHVSIVPYEGVPVKDGFMVIGALNDQQFYRLCQLINRPELPNDPKYKLNRDRVKNRKELIPILREVFQTKTKAEWLPILEAARLPCGPVNTMKEVFEDPQVVHREMLTEIEHEKEGKIKLTGLPVKFSETKASIRMPPPSLDQHTEEVLRDVLGYDNEKIQKLKSVGACFVK